MSGTTIAPDRMMFGAPASLTVDGEEAGATFTAPSVSIEYTTNADKTTPQGARSKIKGMLFVKTAVCKVKFRVNEWASTKLGWVMPGSTATSSESVGVPGAGASGGTLATTLAANPALGATTLDLTSVTTVAVGDFVRVGPAGVAATEANSEIVRIVVKGTAGGTDTIIENSAGGGMLHDFTTADEVKTVIGTILSAPCVSGATNVKVDVVAGLAPGEFVRIGDAARYETRALTAVGTALVGGTGLTFAIPLTRDHGLDAWVVKVSGLSQVTIQPVAGRMPLSAHHDVVLTGVDLAGNPLIVELDDAISLVNQDIAFSDDDWAGFAVELEAYGDPLQPTLLPWRIKYSA